MYVPAAFAVNEMSQVVSFIEANRFATLCINGPEGPLVAYVPLVVVTDDGGQVVELIGHIARANPFEAAIGEGGCDVVAVFRGADAYVSPSFYPSKQEHGKVVPTWNYLAAEVRGRLSLERDPTKMTDYLEPLTDAMESHRPLPWAVQDAPATYLASQYRGIVGLRIAVTEITAKRKVSQNKSDADFNGVVAGLLASSEPNNHALASEMMKERSTQS
jgi:transcriptional regulator